MKYLNQLEYEHIPYPTDLEHPDSDYATRGNIRKAGCGLCSVCMVVSHFTDEPFSLEDCRDLSVAVGANRELGTDMKILGPAAAERFGLLLKMTNDPRELVDCLHRGGAAIVHVGGDREGHTGTFSDIGHYIVATDEVNGEFRILDPAWQPDKYAVPPRSERVRQLDKALYATAEILLQDATDKGPAFYLFLRPET